MHLLIVITHILQVILIKLLKKHNIYYSDLFIKKSFKLKNLTHIEQWKISIIQELVHMRDYKLFEYVNTEEILSMLNFLCTM